MTKIAKENLTADKVKKVGEIIEDWFDEGLRIIIMRGPASFCAYVGIPESHPLANFSYDELSVSAHGGLTFAREGGKAWPLGFYWYGWDYSHCGDMCSFPKISEELSKLEKDEKNWTIKEIKEDIWETIYDFKKLMKLAEKINQRS